MSFPRIGIHGVCGRMGKTLVAAVSSDAEAELAAALDAPGHPLIGHDVGSVCGIGELGVPITDHLIEHVDCIIDFSVPGASVAIAKECAERKIALLVATTGLNDRERQEILERHHDCPLMIASNCSLAVNLLMKLTAEAARILRDRDFDVEIIERHHRYKKDAPSGTALAFAQIIEAAMNLTDRRYGREGITGERPRTEIGLHSLRVGDNVGEHTIVFSTLGETMELVHRGHGRESYAKGALAAAKFLAAQKPGLYTMADVLGL